MSARRHRARGQAIVEFSIVATLFLVIAIGIVNFGFMFEKKLVIASAANNGARFGATHSHATSNAASPASNTIEGVIQATSASVTIPNTDTNIIISYWVLGGGSPTKCGTYLQATNSISYVAGYTAANCGQPNDLIDVKVSITATFVAPILSDAFKNGITMSNDVSTVIAV